MYLIIEQCFVELLKLLVPEPRFPLFAMYSILKLELVDDAVFLALPSGHCQL